MLLLYISSTARGEIRVRLGHIYFQTSNLESVSAVYQDKAPKTPQSQQNQCDSSCLWQKRGFTW